MYNGTNKQKEGYHMKNYLDIRNDYQKHELEKIATILRNGGIVLFPTETVYGIGTNGLDEKAVEKIYAIKKRNRKNPSNLLVSSMAMVETIAEDISPMEYKLMEAFFPGPFTLILKRKKIVPDIVTANSDLVGIRMPDSSIAKKLVELAGVPIVAPSANISGKLSGTELTNVMEEFADQLDFAIDGGESKIGMESTIVRVIDNIPHIVRPGFITPEQIKEVCGDVILEEDKNHYLPSSKMEHYQLSIKSTLVYSENNQKMIDTILNLSKRYIDSTVLCCNENIKFYQNETGIQNVIGIASKNNLEEYMKKLFSSLQKASSLSPDMLLIEGVKKEGLGIAIMNRLLNVCNDNFIEI